MDMELKNPDIRYVHQMENVIADKEWAKENSQKELYYMYRGVDEKDGLRYDVTVIPALFIGNEFNKTKGHEHSSMHMETYTVLEGEAIFLMQKGDVQDVYAIKAKKGESVILPKDYSHITINPSETETLKMSNWVSKECVSDYKTINEKKGAAYFFTKNGWIKNNNYNNIPEIRFEEPLKEMPQNLDFLK
jgi:glucose-6-phosphate isomerase